MKQFFLSMLLVSALVISACNETPDNSAPVAPTSVVADENLASAPGDGITVDPTLSSSIADAEAIAWLRIILQANTNITTEQQRLAKAAIDASTARRQKIMSQRDLTPERRAALLQAEHDALMKALNEIFTREQLANALALKARLDEQNRDRNAKLTELRIQRQVEAWTKLMTLTDRQKAAITDILRKQEAQLVILREQFKNDPAGLRTAIARLQASTDLAIYNLLTDAQKVIWKRLKSNTGTVGRNG